MSVERTLARVERDLERGRVELARRRLEGLTHAHPEDTRLWDRLAELSLRQGDRAAAGRALIFGARADAEAERLRRELVGSLDERALFAALLGTPALRRAAFAPQVRGRLVALFGDDWEAAVRRRRRRDQAVGLALAGVFLALLLAGILLLALGLLRPR